MTKKLLGAAILATLLTAGVANVAHAEEAAAKEKCYGVVKAGSNDCGAKDGSNSCAGSATVDGEGWVFVPAGLCDKLVGGKKE